MTCCQWITRARQCDTRSIKSTELVGLIEIFHPCARPWQRSFFQVLTMLAIGRRSGPRSKGWPISLPISLLQHKCIHLCNSATPAVGRRWPECSSAATTTCVLQCRCYDADTTATKLHTIAAVRMHTVLHFHSRRASWRRRKSDAAVARRMQ